MPTNRGERGQGGVVALALALALGLASARADDGAASAPSAPPPDAGATPATRGLKLGLSYPPMRDAGQMAFTARHLRALDVRLVRYEERWALREPTPGAFQWGPLDARIAFAQAHQVSLLLNIRADGPAWAVGPVRNAESAVFANAPAFSNFVAKLVQRYRGRIAKLQFGNEWHSEFWYAGTAEEFVYWNNLFYDTVKQHAPELPVVLGGLSIGGLRGLAVLDGRLNYYYDDAGRKRTGPQLERLRRSVRAQALSRRIDTVLQGSRYDLLDLHLYDDAEDWPAMVASIRARVPDKAFIVSEFGGPNADWEPYSEKVHAQRLETYIRTLEDLGVTEAYYYKLVVTNALEATSPHRYSTLLDGQLREKPAYDVFRAHSRGQYGAANP